MTPETLVRVLATIRGVTAFHVFYDALPIAGVDGTIARRMKGTPAEGNVHAKTGSVAKARSLIDGLLARLLGATYHKIGFSNY